MALRTNTTGFTGNSPVGSGIEYRNASDYFSMPPLSFIFSFKVNSYGNGTAAAKAVAYFFDQLNYNSVVFQADPVAYSPKTYIECYSYWPGASPSTDLSFYFDENGSGNVPSFELNTWYDIAFSLDRATGDGGTGKLYGCIGRSGYNEWYITTNSTVYTAMPQKTSLSSWIGAVAFDAWLNMTWDNVKVWSAALTPNELRNERQKRLSRTKDIHSWLPTIDTSNAACLINLAGNGKNWKEYYENSSSAKPTYVTGDSSPNGWGSSPIRTYGSYEGSLKTYYRALVLQNGKITSLPTGQEGTGKKALVLNNGKIAERTASEGTPIVLKNGKLTTINTNTEGIII